MKKKLYSDLDKNSEDFKNLKLHVVRNNLLVVDQKKNTVKVFNTTGVTTNDIS